MKRNFFTIFFLCFSFLVSAQRTTYYDDHTGMSSSKVGSAVQDSRGLVWFATWNGLNVFDGYSFHWIKNSPGDGSMLHNDHIRNMMLSPEGNLWCYTEEDVVEFNLKTYTFQPLPKALQDKIRRKLSRPWNRMIDRQDNVWSGKGRGVYKTSIVHHPALRVEGTQDKHARAMMLDDEDRLWVATKEDETIRIYDKELNLLTSIPMGQKAYSLYQYDEEHVFVGCKPAAFLRISPISSDMPGALSHIDRISNDEVYEMQRDSKGRLWVASFNGGLMCFPHPLAEKPAYTKFNTHLHARSLLITPRGNIILGTSHGLYVGHINEKDYTKTTFKHLIRNGNDESSLSCGVVMDIVRASDGTIYLATASSGIDMIKEDDLFTDSPKFTHFNDNNSSITTDFCRSLTLLSDTTLLIVGSNNMMIFNPKSDITTNYNHIFFADTCHFAEGRPVVLDNGSIVFGAEEGAFLARAQSMYRQGYIPPLIITNIYINGKEADHLMPTSNTVHLTPAERSVIIKYAALDLGENSQILYRTKLDDSQWTRASYDREMMMYDLEPGTHTLQIQSTDRYGRWVVNTVSIAIEVDYRWYERRWVQVLIWLVSLGIIAAMIHLQFYIRNLKRQRQETLEKYMALMGADDKRTEERGEWRMQRGEKREESEERSGEQQWFMDKVREYIEENIGNSDANIDDMAASAATSRSTLNRRLNSIMGITAAQLLIDARMQHAAHLIMKERREKGNISVADIAFSCGYSDPKYFSRCFKQKYGVTPSDYLSQ